MHCHRNQRCVHASKIAISLCTISRPTAAHLAAFILLSLKPTPILHHTTTTCADSDHTASTQTASALLNRCIRECCYNNNRDTNRGHESARSNAPIIYCFGNDLLEWT